MRINKKSSTLSNPQQCKMSFSYDEVEGNTSSNSCIFLNFGIISSTFHITKQHTYENTHKRKNIFHNIQLLYANIIPNNMKKKKERKSLQASLDCGQTFINILYFCNI